MKKEHRKIMLFTALIIVIFLLIYAYIKSTKKEIIEDVKTANVNSLTGMTSNQPASIIQNKKGKYFLGKNIINLTNESINEVYKLTNVPKGTSYAIVHLINCEVEYNQDGDFANGSPTANAQITIDSAPLIEVFNMKVISSIVQNSKIYVEYYQ